MSADSRETTPDPAIEPRVHPELPHAPGQLGLFQKLGFSALTLTLTLGGLELSSYAAWGSFTFPPDPLVTDHEHGWGKSRRFDPLLFWSLRPGIRMSTYRTNSDGVRGEEISRPKPTDEFRVLSLGESSTFAGELPFPDCYSGALEASLGSVGEKRLRVINAGVPGYTLFQGWLYLAERGLDFEPDAVLLYFGYNDFLPVAHLRGRFSLSTYRDDVLDDWTLFEQRNAPLARLNIALASASNVYRGLGTLILGDQPYRMAGVQREDKNPRVNKEQRKELLGRIAELCEERGIQLTVVIPWYVEFDKHEPFLRNYTRNKGLTVVDLPARLAELPKARAEYFRDDWHPTAEGHHLIAAQIREVVQPVWEAWR